MAASLFSGPTIIYGDMDQIPGLVPSYNLDAGPSLTYQGDGLPDVRFAPINKDNILPGTVRAHLNFPYMLSVDAVPAALGAANIAALANVTSGTPMTLAGASAGISPNIPIIPFKGSAVVTPAITLDFGFDTGNFTSGNTSVVVADSSIYTLGEPLVCDLVGNAGGTVPLLTNVVGIPDATHIVLNNAPLATNASARIGTGNSWPMQALSSLVAPTAAQPYIAAGAGLFLDPTQAIARGLRVTGVLSGTGGNFLVTGYDIYGMLMTELINATAGATTTWGKKAFKAIVSVVPQFTDAHNYSVGTSDVFGTHFRSDRWEYNNWFWAGAFLTASTGWTAGVKTSPSTNSTGDVRGTLQIGTNGPLGSGAAGGASNGTLRLALFQTLPLFNLTAGKVVNPVSIYGQTQSTT